MFIHVSGGRKGVILEQKKEEGKGNKITGERKGEERRKVKIEEIYYHVHSTIGSFWIMHFL